MIRIFGWSSLNRSALRITTPFVLLMVKTELNEMNLPLAVMVFFSAILRRN